MFIDINENFNFMKVIYEGYIGDKCIYRQELQAPPELLQITFQQDMLNLPKSQLTKIKMIRYDQIWDNFEKKHKVLENFIEVSKK